VKVSLSIPTSITAMKGLSVAPPNNRMAIITNIAFSCVARERCSVSMMLRFTISEKGSPR